MVQTFGFHGIAGCVTHLYVRKYDGLLSKRKGRFVEAYLVTEKRRQNFQHAIRKIQGKTKHRLQSIP